VQQPEEIGFGLRCTSHTVSSNALFHFPPIVHHFKRPADYFVPRKQILRRMHAEVKEPAADPLHKLALASIIRDVLDLDESFQASTGA